jgi:hypothetical protein
MNVYVYVAVNICEVCGDDAERERERGIGRAYVCMFVCDEW